MYRMFEQRAAAEDGPRVDRTRRASSRSVAEPERAPGAPGGHRGRGRLSGKPGRGLRQRDRAAGRRGDHGDAVVPLSRPPRFPSPPPPAPPVPCPRRSRTPPRTPRRPGCGVPSPCSVRRRRAPRPAVAPPRRRGPRPHPQQPGRDGAPAGQCHRAGEPFQGQRHRARVAGRARRREPVQVQGRAASASPRSSAMKPSSARMSAIRRRRPAGGPVQPGAATPRPRRAGPPAARSAPSPARRTPRRS